MCETKSTVLAGKLFYFNSDSLERYYIEAMTSLCSLFFLCSLFLFYILTPKKRLIQPPYRQPEYPLRERDSTRDLGPSGGSCGGMIHKHFTDQENQNRNKYIVDNSFLEFSCVCV